MLGTCIQHQLRLVRPTIPLASHRITPAHDDLDLPSDSIDRTTPVERTAPPSRGPVGAHRDLPRTAHYGNVADGGQKPLAPRSNVDIQWEQIRFPLERKKVGTRPARDDN